MRHKISSVHSRIHKCFHNGLLHYSCIRGSNLHLTIHNYMSSNYMYNNYTLHRVQTISQHCISTFSHITFHTNLYINTMISTIRATREATAPTPICATSGKMEWLRESYCTCPSEKFRFPICTCIQTDPLLYTTVHAIQYPQQKCKLKPHFQKRWCRCNFNRVKPDIMKQLETIVQKVLRFF